MTSLRLAGLLCSRLCHDLAGPIGALQNGIELLAEDDDPALREQALDLVAMASGQAGGKLRFFRLVFGAGVGGGEDLSSEECRSVLSDFLAGGRVTLQWDPPVDRWPRAHGRLLLALALLASHGLPRGGRLNVMRVADGVAPLAAVAGEGSGATLDARIEAFLNGSEDVAAAVTPNEAIACLARELGNECDLLVAVDRGGDRFAFLPQGAPVSDNQA